MEFLDWAIVIALALCFVSCGIRELVEALKGIP
jgi:hypothetical protein